MPTPLEIAQAGIGAVQAGEAAQQQRQLLPSQLRQQAQQENLLNLQLAQQGINLEQVRSEQNLQKTANRLQEINALRASGASEQQVSQLLSSFIEESQAQGINPVDTLQAKQALDAGGFEQLDPLLNQATQVFQARGLIQTPAPEKMQFFETAEGIVGVSPTTAQATIVDLGDTKTLSQVQSESKQRAEQLKQELADTKDKREQSDKLRKEVFDRAKSLKFIDVTSAFDRIQASAEDPSPAGDLALIFNFMKMLDPGSTVREGEFANAQNAGGVDDTLRGLYNRVTKGTRLTEPQRADFLNRSNKLFKQSEARFNKVIQPTLAVGRSRGLSKEDILGEGFSEAFAAEQIDVVETPEETTVSREAVIETPGIQEGTIIENDAGERMILRNGQWVPI